MEKNKLNILNKFFSRNTFRHCYEEGYDKIYGQVIKKYGDVTSTENVYMFRQFRH